LIEKGNVVVIRKGWSGAGRRGIVVGPKAIGRDRDDWTPVLWDDEDDPTFFKEAGLDIYIPKTMVISIEFIAQEGEIYAVKKFNTGGSSTEKVGHTPSDISNWMRKIAAEDGCDLNEAMRRAFGGEGST
jgi:hypothetical protein